MEPEFFYLLWKDSFNKERYKQSCAYFNFIKKEKIVPLNDMGKYMKMLLEKY